MLVKYHYSFDKTKYKLILLTDLISISHKHQTKFMVFVGNKNKYVTKLLELNFEQKQ
jgi:hypothetical protein